MKITEAKLEEAIIALLVEQGFPHVSDTTITRAPEEVHIRDDLRKFLGKRYASEGLSEGEVNTVISQLETVIPLTNSTPVTTRSSSLVARVQEQGDSS